jgi:hypothetical protein
MSGLDSSPGATGEESLSPLEQEVLDEYVRLAGNLGDVSLYFFAIKHAARYPLSIVHYPNSSLYNNTPSSRYRQVTQRHNADKCNSFLHSSMTLLPVPAQKFLTR